MMPDTEPASSAAPSRRKPRISFLLATSFGLGYLPRAPGTWGSLAGVILAALLIDLPPRLGGLPIIVFFQNGYLPLSTCVLACCCLLVALVGVWTSSRVARFCEKKDPQFVVIDEVSGQLLALLPGVAMSATYDRGEPFFFSSAPWWHQGIKWSVLLTGFVLFRLFDIWKPWPIRKLEKLPGGWGIMADDWLAGIYAAILLRLALHFNVL